MKRKELHIGFLDSIPKGFLKLVILVQREDLSSEVCLVAVRIDKPQETQCIYDVAFIIRGTPKPLQSFSSNGTWE